MNLRAILSKKSFTSTVYNTAVGEKTTVLDLFNKIKKSLACYDPKIAEISPEFNPMREGDVPHSLASIKKANTELGYKPQVFIDQGINKTVEWFYNSKYA